MNNLLLFRFKTLTLTEQISVTFSRFRLQIIIAMQLEEAIDSGKHPENRDEEY